LIEGARIQAVHRGRGPWSAAPATRIGGELMGMPVGMIKSDYMADLLRVDGDPLGDVRLLQNPARLRLIMKDGVYARDTLSPP
jgi:imidazolonepropionase-like amidohydrolase